jgi:hypothetical protein
MYKVLMNFNIIVHKKFMDKVSDSTLQPNFYYLLPGIVVYFCNPNAWEAESGGSRVQGQPGLPGKTMSQEKPVVEFCIVKEEYLKLFE